MDIKDKLNLAWKFLFLAVFTYGVMSMTCCKSSCDSQAQCCSKNAPACSKSAPAKAACGVNCQKPCCVK